MDWKPISEAPKDGTQILAGRFSPTRNGHPNNIIRIDRWHNAKDDGYSGWGSFNAEYWPATHWMPLPEPPAAQ